jgi:hypothetical protein
MEEIENLNTKRRVSTEKFALEAHRIVNPRESVLFYDSTEIEH